MTDNEDLMALTHVGEDPHKYMGAVTPPVFLTSLHVFDSVDDYFDVDIFKDEYYYGRASNPTVSILEKKVAALEHGKRAVVFSAGMATCAAVVLACCSAGDHIICIKESYGPVRHLISDFLPKMNISTTYVQGDSVKEFEDAIQHNTKLIILESPTTLLFNVIDLKGVAKLAKEHGIKTYIDNTYCSPIFQKPLDMGIDFVMHTMTKYIGGHSDLIGGVVVSNDDDAMEKLMVQRDWFGGVLGPMEAWLAIRGLRTLDVRINRHYETALKVAEYLNSHPKIKKVYYTGLKSHPNYNLAREQQTGESGLMTIEIDGDEKATAKFVDSLKIFEIGCSWGGFESLAIAYTYNWDDEELKYYGLNRSVVRLHCGLEGAENLIADLEQALKQI